MQKNLVIVESPAKAKTIEKFLGEDFKVMSSYGHIRDLKKKNFGVDLETFKPEYEIPDDKKNVVKELRAQARKSEAVWLASDEDREGEAISWHLAEVLKINPQESKRIVFHEITKPAILDAIAHPRHIDLNLVDAQQARRVLDRLVGFKLSPVLWRRVRPSLSAGRLCSPFPKAERPCVQSSPSVSQRRKPQPPFSNSVKRPLSPSRPSTPVQQNARQRRPSPLPPFSRKQPASLVSLWP